MAAPDAGPPVNNLAGALWMLAAVTTFTVMQIMLKELMQHQGMPVTVVIFLRMAFGILAALPWLVRQGPRALATPRLGLHFLRSFFGIASLTCFAFGLANLLFADAVALTFSTPLWSILIAALVLGEPIRFRRWAATAIGFAGVLLIVRPTGEVNPWMLVALLGALGGCGVFVTLKKLAGESSMLGSFYSHAFAVLMIAPFALWYWQTPDPFQWLLLALTGVMSYLGQSFFARAFAHGEVGIVAPLEFARMPMAVLFGLLLFAELPGPLTILGIAIVAGASVYIVRREGKLRKGT
ncbi:MAG: DMT family transporter [Acetobacterales bacterium]